MEKQVRGLKSIQPFVVADKYLILINTDNVSFKVHFFRSNNLISTMLLLHFLKHLNHLSGCLAVAFVSFMSLQQPIQQFLINHGIPQLP